MKFNKAALIAMSLAFVGLIAVIAIAQSGSFLPASDASTKYQQSQFTPAGAGDTFTPQEVDSSGAVGWGGGGSGGLVYVPAVTPSADSAEGGAGRVNFTDLLEGETATVGILFEAFTSDNSETGFAAGGATVEITAGSGGSYRLQVFAEQNGARLLMVSNDFSLTSGEQEEISSGGSVTVESSNRAGDNPFHFASITLTFADSGTVIMGDIHLLSPE